MSNKTDVELIDRWRQGDEEAATEIYARYVDRMTQLIDRHIPQTMQARFDAQDVAQSTFRSMFRRSQDGHFEFEGDADFWKLLLTIALNKVRRKIHRNNAEGRNPGRERRVGVHSDPDSFLVDKLSKQPTLIDTIVFADLLETVLKVLKPDEQRVINLRLAGYRQHEIAAELGVKERTVRRMFARIQERAEAIVANAESE